MKVFSVNVPVAADTTEHRLQALVTLRNFVAKINVGQMSFVDVDAPMGAQIVSVIMTDQLYEGLKALLEWACLYFRETDNHDNDVMMADLFKTFRMVMPPHLILLDKKGDGTPN